MMTIDTMIYIILAISGIATVSLYLNIYCAIKLHNTLDQSNKLDSANDAVENLHIENMKLNEDIITLKNKVKQLIPRSVQENYKAQKEYYQRPNSLYIPELDQDKIEKIIDLQWDISSRSRNDVGEAVYTENITHKKTDE